jgi:XapX domain-containing protein
VNEIIGLVLGLAIGGACRWFDIPVPAPPRITGALLVVAMTLGFLATDAVLASETPMLCALVSDYDLKQDNQLRKHAC